jgi:transcriptional regulator GlxA family with amidase domain
MTPVEKAIWFIESHFAQPLDLDEIADAGGVSRFHMSRAFGVATNRPVIGYLRARRLTEAAGVGLRAGRRPVLGRYGPEFDPRTGEGGLEAWIPVKRK